MMLIVTDGRCNKQNVTVLVNNALCQGVLPLLLILDGANKIYDMKQASMSPDGKVKVSSYLEDLPFPYYAVVQNLESLPQLFCDVLRQ